MAPVVQLAAFDLGDGGCQYRRSPIQRGLGEPRRVAYRLPLDGEALYIGPGIHMAALAGLGLRAQQATADIAVQAGALYTQHGGGLLAAQPGGVVERGMSGGRWARHAPC